MKKTLLLLFLLGLVACGPTEPVTPRVEDIQTAIAQTQAALPTTTTTTTTHPPTATPLPTATPTPFQTSTPTPAGPFTVTIAAAFLNMRTGPSTLFDVVETFEAGITFQAIARSTSGDWILVQQDDGAQGWFASLYLDFAEDPGALQVEYYPNQQAIQGHVQDTEGNGIGGITIAVIYRDATSELRADVTTIDDGYFITFFPADMLGTLDVQIVGINCISPIMDEECQISAYFELEGRAFVNIPQEELLRFQYEAASATLTGTVVDDNNRLLANILVVAERDDGAESFGSTNAAGEFSIAIGEGVWEVYTVTFDPREEGTRLTAEITNQLPPILELTAP